MSNSKLKTAYILTALIAVLTLIASAGGLLIDDLYRDNALITAGWFGNDLVTLVVALPLLVVSLALSMRGARRARLIWLGMIAYTLYNFSYYLFGTAFNSFFLIYVALFDLSLFALIYGLIGLDGADIGQRFRPRTPAKGIASFMIFVALGLTFVYTSQSLAFVFTGTLPEIITLTDKATNVVFALDLTMVVPWFIVGAIWLWQRRPWGYVLATIVNIKGAAYMLALTAVVAGIGLLVVRDLYRVGMIAPPVQDRVANFDRLWQAMDTYYPYFEMKEIDWDAMYERYRPQVEQRRATRPITRSSNRC